jgi:hypothetical protein
MVTRLISNNFVGGEISPSLYGRSDLAAYYKGCAKAENFVIGKVGSLRKRRGLVSFGSPVGRSWENCRIFAYKYDRVTSAFLVVYLAGRTVYGEIWDKQIGDAPKIPRFTIYVSTKDFTSTDWIKEIQFTQIGDTLFLTCAYFIKQITVTNYTLASRSVTVGAVTQTEPPSKAAQFTATPSGFSGQDGYKTAYYEAVTVKNGVMGTAVYATAKIGISWTSGATVALVVKINTTDCDYVIIGKRAGGFYGELTRFYSTDTPDATSGNFKTFRFYDENISPGDLIYPQTNTLGDDFQPPRCINCFQQRLCYANSANGGSIRTVTVNNGHYETITETVDGEEVTRTEWVDDGETTTTQVIGAQTFPMSLWFSEVGNIYNFFADRPATDDDPFSPTIMSTGPAFIRWLIVYQESMLVFTDCGIFSIKGSTSEGFCAATCRITFLDDTPCSTTIAPISTVSGVTFVGGNNKTIYSMSYDWQSDSTRPIDRTILASHLTEKTEVVAIARQQYPDEVVWVALSDGTFLSFTTQPEQEVFAWARHRIEGSKVIDILGLGTVTENKTGKTFGDMIFVVQREDTGDIYYARAMDVYADSIGGSVNSVVSTLVTLRPESQEKTIIGQFKNIKEMIIRLHESGGVKCRAYNDGESALELVGTNPGTADDLFSGDIKITPRGYINDEGQMEVVSDNSLPCEILSIVSIMEI